MRLNGLWCTVLNFLSTFQMEVKTFDCCAGSDWYMWTSIRIIGTCWFNSPVLDVIEQDAEPQNCSGFAGRHLAWQPPPSVYEWIIVSRFGQKLEMFVCIYCTLSVTSSYPFYPHHCSTQSDTLNVTSELFWQGRKSTVISSNMQICNVSVQNHQAGHGLAVKRHQLAELWGGPPGGSGVTLQHWPARWQVERGFLHWVYVDCMS